MNDLTARVDALAANHWRRDPASFAERTSHGRWKRYDWLDCLSGVLADRIREGGQRIIVEAPPRSGKSEFISKYLPAWFLELYPHKEVIVASYGRDLAKTRSKEVRDLLISSDTWTKPARGSQSAAHWRIEQGGGMKAAGLKTGTTGFGGDLVIIDDPIKDWQQARSASYRQAVIDWFESVIYTRLAPGATIIVVMTRWHHKDLAGWLLDEHGDEWEELRFPAIAETNDYLGRKIGEALCPERYDEEALAAIKRGMANRKWIGLYQQRPSAEGGTIINVSDLRYWWEGKEPPKVEIPLDDGTVIEVPQRRLPSEFIGTVGSWDLAFKKKKDSDFVAGHVWCWDKANRYLIDREHDRMSFKDSIKAVHRIDRRHPGIEGHLVEDAANGPAIVNILEDEIPAMNLIPPKGGKEERMEACSPQWSAGNVWIPHPYMPGYRWSGEVQEQILNFPTSIF